MTKSVIILSREWDNNGVWPVVEGTVAGWSWDSVVALATAIELWKNTGWHHTEMFKALEATPLAGSEDSGGSLSYRVTPTGIRKPGGDEGDRLIKEAVSRHRE